MKQLAAQFFAMSVQDRRQVIVSLCDHALGIWESHYSPGSQFTYQESVAGSIQVLDVGLPREALEAIRVGVDACEIAQRYKEPIVALQDLDLEFPDAAEFAYYAIYNAFRMYISHVSVEERLVLNQALSSLPEDEMQNAFSSAVANAG